jgi:hypothetical protein
MADERKLSDLDDKDPIELWEEQLAMVARHIQERVLEFAAAHGNAMLCGTPLPVEAAEQFGLLTRDAHRLVRIVTWLQRPSR